MDQAANLVILAFTTWCGAIFLQHLTDASLSVAIAGAFFTLMALKS